MSVPGWMGIPVRGMECLWVYMYVYYTYINLYKWVSLLGVWYMSIPVKGGVSVGIFVGVVFIYRGVPKFGLYTFMGFFLKWVVCMSLPAHTTEATWCTYS